MYYYTLKSVVNFMINLDQVTLVKLRNNYFNYVFDVLNIIYLN
jgi:hypothetical protein